MNLERRLGNFLKLTLNHNLFNNFLSLFIFRLFGKSLLEFLNALKTKSFKIVYIFR